MSFATVGIDNVEIFNGTGTFSNDPQYAYGGIEVTIYQENFGLVIMNGSGRPFKHSSHFCPILFLLILRVISRTSVSECCSDHPKCL